MITIQKSIPDIPEAAISLLNTLPSSVNRIPSSPTWLFFDIETTGLSRERHQIYLIGALFWNTEGRIFYQWLSQKPEEEPLVLTSFLQLLQQQSAPVVPVHFNGTRFDLPFFEIRCKACGLDSHGFCVLPDIDLYLHIKKIRTLLGLANCRQKTIEDFLHIRRKDVHDGGALIPVFHRYCQNRDTEDERLLLLHNEEDVQNMPRLTAIFSYETFFRQPFVWHRCEEAQYQDWEGKEQRELFVVFRAEQMAIPAPLTLQYDFPGKSKKASACKDSGRFWISCKKRELTLRIPLKKRKLKYFFADYKNYFYLPAEDQAIHKSIGTYVDPQFRQKATAKTCYTRIDGLFFPALHPDQQPCFYEEYKDRQRYLRWEYGDTICGQPTEDFWKCYLQILITEISGI